MVPTSVVETESPGPQPSALTIKLSRHYCILNPESSKSSLSTKSSGSLTA